MKVTLLSEGVFLTKPLTLNRFKERSLDANVHFFHSPQEHKSASAMRRRSHGKTECVTALGLRHFGRLGRGRIGNRCRNRRGV